MTDIILNNPRRGSAEFFGTLLILGQAIGFGILPVYALLHPEYGAPPEWFIATLSAVVSLLAMSIVAWRMFGREAIVLDAGVLRVRYTAGFLHRSLSLRLSKETEVGVVPPGRSEIPNNVFGIGHRSVLVRNAAGQLRCGMALAEHEAEGVAERIRDASSARGAVEQGIRPDGRGPG